MCVEFAILTRWAQNILLRIQQNVLTISKIKSTIMSNKAHCFVLQVGMGMQNALAFQTIYFYTFNSALVAIPSTHKRKKSFVSHKE